jgi:hypothetical protein
MDILEIIKNKKDFYSILYQKEKDNIQQKKYLHFYEAYYILYNELLTMKKYTNDTATGINKRN